MSKTTNIASWSIRRHADGDDGYDYAPAACLEGDGDDEDRDYDYAPAASMEATVSEALNLKVLEKKRDKMSVVLGAGVVASQSHANAPVVIATNQGLSSVCNLESPGHVGTSRGAAVENQAKRSDVKLTWNLNNG
ncbi:hypothetical protein POTOM_028324 [Populus tomentosa]|uniref:Uncharacterized protein n=1 Tax=Populus tomentosa TaxID=118781 RepID=A0A8X7ZE97_POPTO|nr:hypothetical protein POTOM_028324 [Populus tomentosa]